MNRQIMSMVTTVSSVVVVLFALVTIVSIAIIPDVSSAQGFVPCDGADTQCSFCHVIQLGNNVLNWLFGLVFVLFGVVTFVAGFELMTSGGNQSKLDDAKKKLSNAVVGIIIIFAAWLVVDTVMKTLVNNGSLTGVTSNLGMWNEISCGIGTQATPGPGATVGAGGGGGPDVSLGEGCVPNLDGTQTCTTISPEPIPGQECTFRGPSGDYSCEEVLPLGGGGGTGSTLDPGACHECSTFGRGAGVDLGGGVSMPFNANPCNGQNTCYVNGTMVNRLGGMGDDTSGWQISEAWPPYGYSTSDPTGVHASACHGTATCIDVSFIGSTPNANQIRNFTTSAAGNNLTAVYEVPSEARATALRNAGVSNVLVVPGINREHFSVYMCDVDGSPRACGG